MDALDQAYSRSWCFAPPLKILDGKVLKIYNKYERTKEREREREKTETKKRIKKSYFVCSSLIDS